MATLTQAIEWLIKGHRVRPQDWHKQCYMKYSETQQCLIDEDGEKLLDLYFESMPKDGWELLPDYEPEEVAFKPNLPITNGLYLVWDIYGNEDIAIYTTKNKTFLSTSPYNFTLHVDKWLPMPKKPE